MLEKGEQYTVSTGGSCDGDITDGMYTGNYEGGNVYETFEITEIMTAVGNATGGMGGFGPGGQRPGEGMEKPGGGRR